MKVTWVTYLGLLSRLNAILIPRISVHPPILAQCKVHRPWALFREGTVYTFSLHFLLRPLQINSLFLITPEPKNRCGRGAGNGRLITSLMENGCKNISSAVQNQGGILLYYADAGGNTCGRKLRGMRSNWLIWSSLICVSISCSHVAACLIILRAWLSLLAVRRDRVAVKQARLVGPRCMLNYT